MKNTIDINSDMGESFGPWIIGDGVDEQIMKYISSCNIAAGFHAGDPNIMRTSVKNAIENKVNIGVHPGYRDLVGFGRRQIIAKNEELINDCIYQLGALREFINLEGGKLSHFKLHGSLYMFAAKDKEFSQILVDILHKIDNQLPIFCMDKSALYEAAQQKGHPCVKEFYGDREYADDGMIVMVRKAQTYNPKEVANRVLKACKRTCKNYNRK
ncbi:5-oxoprolinase subunit PxpA [Campylobacter hepaticus]|nr:5-oxoprolinase subunit PxpA [Campylobacter hepaticus]WAP49530.1 5-oxoprolinase subunit PxpA [Campylobacter hepaticus]